MGATCCASNVDGSTEVTANEFHRTKTVTNTAGQALEVPQWTDAATRDTAFGSWSKAKRAESAEYILEDKAEALIYEVYALFAGELKSEQQCNQILEDVFGDELSYEREAFFSTIEKVYHSMKM